MGINETGVSRRSFITGAAAAGVLATLGLAGCTPQDKQTASAATSGSDTKWDEECDVLVVGSGYTGLAAALEAKNAGADVKVIEKTARVGGNSALAAGDFAVCNSSVQKREGVQDSVEQYVDDMMVAGLHLNDKEKCRVVDMDLQVIPGLYAAGEAVGGIHGACRLGSCATADCLVNGRIAGQNAAKEQGA